MYPQALSARFEGSFAYFTVRDRLPVIITRIIDHLCREKLNLKNKYGEDCIEDVKNIVGGLSELKNHMQTNKPIEGISELHHKPNDDIFWKKAFDEHRQFYGKSPQWFNSSWLFVEVYLYRKIHELFDQSLTLTAYDPFHHEKRKSFESSVVATSNLLEYTVKITKTVGKLELQTSKCHLLNFLQVSLWGNQYDLSLFSCAEKAQGVDILSNLDKKKDSILTWELDEAFDYLESVKNQGKIIGVVLDNAGFELISDLCLSTFLVQCGYGSKVYFYTKTRPYYVSDTMKQDIDFVLDLLSSGFCASGKHLSELWRAYLSNGVFVIREESFWTAPQDFSEMKKESPSLYEELGSKSLLLFKGDLNYRKLVGDLDWPLNTPFIQALRGFKPAPILVLRTVKGGPVVGLDPESDLVKKARKKIDWASSGDHGMTHFVKF